MLNNHLSNLALTLKILQSNIFLSIFSSNFSHFYLMILPYFLCVDNGGGMDPDKMRQCMSLGYSAKCKIANTIGQCEFPPLRRDIFCLIV